MPRLSERLLHPDARPQVVDGCCALIEREVAGKRGLSGMAVKTGFGVVTRIKPGFIREIVSKLLPEFVDALEPMYAESVAAAGEGGPVADDFIGRVEREKARAAEALLGVTDRRIDDARPSVRSAYRKLRPSARDNVEAALPGLLSTLRPHL